MSEDEKAEIMRAGKVHAVAFAALCQHWQSDDGDANIDQLWAAAVTALDATIALAKRVGDRDIEAGQALVTLLQATASRAMRKVD